jgi:hypothetical protein
MMRMFSDWCALNSEKTHLASPAVVARFVTDIAPLGIARVWKAVQEISRTFYVIGLADPTLSGPVAAAINQISKIPAPRSWPKEDQIRFLTLPYDVQLIIEKRERDRDKRVQQLQNEVAQIRKESDHARTATIADTAA